YTIDHSRATCKKCCGRGVNIDIDGSRGKLDNTSHIFSAKMLILCPDCQGSGIGQGTDAEDDRWNCTHCDSLGVRRIERELSIVIDRGMYPGESLVFRGEADHQPGMDPGSVIVPLLALAHPYF